MSRIYGMNLHNEPFSLILSGNKTVEMRLNKNGRENISQGDTIVFTNQNGDKLEVLVVNIFKFPGFKELYNSYPKDRLGYLPSEDADPNDMLKYYKQEDIEKYGVLAIEIQLIK